MQQKHRQAPAMVVVPDSPTGGPGRSRTPPNRRVISLHGSPSATRTSPRPSPHLQVPSSPETPNRREARNVAARSDPGIVHTIPDSQPTPEIPDRPRTLDRAGRELPTTPSVERTMTEPANLSPYHGGTQITSPLQHPTPPLLGGTEEEREIREMIEDRTITVNNQIVEVIDGELIADLVRDLTSAGYHFNIAQGKQWSRRQRLCHHAQDGHPSTHPELGQICA